jgi:cytochrome c peroxidase
MLLTVACAFAGGTLLLTSNALAQKKAKKQAAGPASTTSTIPGVEPQIAIFGPLPPITQPPNTVPLTPVEQLGKDLVFDITLSDPPGYACFTCHTPETGHASPGPPDGSEVNAILGIPPGVVPGRFRERKPSTYAMSAFSPTGPYYDANLGVYIGGMFWDGHAPDEAHQALLPFINPNEMDNIPGNGIYPPVAGGYSPLVVQKVQSRPYTPLFKQVYGPDVFTKYTVPQLYMIITYAIAAYEASAEVNPFSSMYDASKYGVPPQNLYTLSASEERGRILYGVGPNPSNNPNFGNAQCFQCHLSANLLAVQAVTGGKEMFTMFCYANIGAPKNPNNPYYKETDPTTNPHGYNPLGTNFIDWGLGRNPNPAPDGTKFYDNTPGDIPQFRGLMKAPSVRNSDKRPYPTFVRAYMHNGVFKSLQEVVHFYNKRNIAVNANGQEVAFDLREGPPAGYTPLLPPPEVLDNVQNVAGLTPAQAAAMGVAGVTATNGQVGNLQLTPSQEADLVNFLKILTDGYTKPNPIHQGP